MDKLTTYVNSLLQRRQGDWPPANELDKEEFVEQTLPYIQKRLQVTDEQAMEIALRLWGTLRMG